MDKEECEKLFKWDRKLNDETEKYIKKLYGEKSKVISIQYKNHKDNGFIKIDVAHDNG